MNRVSPVIVSVIIPTRNRPRLLERALLSVAKQDFPGTEVCVIDNNPEPLISEQARRCVEKFKDEFPGTRWQYLHSSQKFAAGARNDGMRAASGKYICLLDDDDELLPGSLEKRLYELTADDELAMIYCGGYSKIYPYPFKLYRYYAYNKMRHREELRMMSCSSIMFNNEIFTTHSLRFDENLSRMDDYDLCRRVIQLDLKVKSIPDALVMIHLHPETRMSSNSLDSYDFKHLLSSKWGPDIDGYLFSYAEGIFIWRKCFGLKTQRYKEICRLLEADFGRKPSLPFKLRFLLVSVHPRVFLGLYHLGIATSQLYRNRLQA